MSRLEPLHPVFDFSAVPELVRLFRGNAEHDSGDGERCVGTGEVLLQFLPSPHVGIQAKFQKSGAAISWVLKDGRSDQSFFLNGAKVEGFSSRRSASAESMVLDWTPGTLPLDIGDMQAKTTVAVTSHLFNFPDFRDGRCQEAAPEGCALLVLESEEWKIVVQSLPDGTTHRACGRIKEEGGCFLTHVVKLERKDGQPFSGEDASEQSYFLSNFLSFTKGVKCGTVCEVGFDAAGEKTWQTFSFPQSGTPPYSWFNRFRGRQAEELFPLFAKRWQQSDAWRDCLIHAIYWYTQANTNGDSLGIDSAIILAQAALERLAYHHLVIDRKMISPQGLDRLKVSDRLRMLFSSLGIPADIVDETPDIKKSAAQCKWIDAPHALIDIRNELVHPIRKKEVNSCFLDAWKLSLWYLELSILALCGYNGVYQNRIKPTPYAAQLHRVPWCKKIN